MTTAHRPTFDPARGKVLPKGPAYHQRLLPAHTKLKVRQPGQGGSADYTPRDLRAELLQAEAANRIKLNAGGQIENTVDVPTLTLETVSCKRNLQDTDTNREILGNLEAKRLKVLEETRDIDADSDGPSGSGCESNDEDSDEEDEEDETAELLRELEKIKKERADLREREERERATQTELRREHDIALGNPLLNPKLTADFNVKRRWDDDVIFKHQARGLNDRDKKEFVNDLLRSDFHKKFMSKYVR